MKSIIFRFFSLVVSIPMLCLGLLALFIPTTFEPLFYIGALLIGTVFITYGLFGKVLFYRSANDDSLQFKNHAIVEYLVILTFLTIFTIRTILDIITKRAGWLEFVYLGVAIAFIIFYSTAHFYNFRKTNHEINFYWVLIAFMPISLFLVLAAIFYDRL